MVFDRPVYPMLTAAQFLEFTFGDRKAELDEGVIRLLDGVTARHATIQGNLLAAMHARLRGTGWRPYLSSMPIRTAEHSVRRADLFIVDGREGHEADADSDEDGAFADPRIVFEIVHIAPRTNLTVKLPEYCELASLDTLVIVDATAERLRVIQRCGPSSWTDRSHDTPVDLPLPALAITLPHAEIFAR